MKFDYAERVWVHEWDDDTNGYFQGFGHVLSYRTHDGFGFTLKEPMYEVALGNGRFSFSESSLHKESDPYFKKV